MNTEPKVHLWSVSIALCMLCSCGGGIEQKPPQEEEALTSVKIDLTTDTRASFFDHFSSLELIPLETNEHSIIKYAGKTIFQGGRYYILDPEQSILFVFDESGRFIGKIDRVGTGPGEYIEIYDFNINQFSNEIEILDPRGRILTYSTELEFINSFRIDLRAAHQFFNMNKDTIVFYTSSEEEKLAFYSRSGNEILMKDFGFSSLERINLFPMVRFRNSPFQIYNGKVIFQVPYSNYVYQITNCSVVPYIYWDFGKHNFKPERIKKGASEIYHLMYYARLKGEAYSFCYFYETNNWMYTMFKYNNQWIGLVYNKKIEKYDLITLYRENIHHPMISYAQEDYILWVTDLNSDLVEKYSPVLNEDQIELLRSVSPESNPVIMKYFIR